MIQETDCSGVPQEVELLQTLVNRFRAEAQGLKERMQELTKFERIARGLSPDDAAICEGWEIDDAGASSRAAVVLARMAQERFAVSGTSLRIPVDELPELEPVALWKYLESTYGGDGAAQSAYRPIAADIVETLRIRPGNEMKSVGGRLCQKRYIRYDAPYGPDFSDRSELKRLIDALRVVGEWSGSWTEAERNGAAAIIAQLNGNHFSMTRAFLKRMNIGAAVLIVPSMTSWDFRFSESFAAHVQLFLSEYGEPTRVAA